MSTEQILRQPAKETFIEKQVEQKSSQKVDINILYEKPINSDYFIVIQVSFLPHFLVTEVYVLRCAQFVKIFKVATGLTTNWAHRKSQTSVIEFWLKNSLFLYAKYALTTTSPVPLI